MIFFRCPYCGKTAMKYCAGFSFIRCYECGKEISCENPKQFRAIVENIFTHLSDWERESILSGFAK